MMLWVKALVAIQPIGFALCVGIGLGVVAAAVAWGVIFLQWLAKG